MRVEIHDEHNQSVSSVPEWHLTEIGKNGRFVTFIFERGDECAYIAAVGALEIGPNPRKGAQP